MGEYIPTEQELVTELCKARECDWERLAEELVLQEKIHSEFGTIATSGYREYLRSHKENFIKIPQEYMLPSAEWCDMALSDILDEVCNAPKEYQRIIFAMINRYRRAARELLTGRAREDFNAYDEKFLEAEILEKELKKEGVRVFADHDDIEQWEAELKRDVRVPLTIDKNDNAWTKEWKEKMQSQRIRAKKWLREWKKQEVQNAEKYSELKKRWESLANDKRSITSDDIPEDDSRCVTFCDEFLFESKLVKKVIALQELEKRLSEVITKNENDDGEDRAWDGKTGRQQEKVKSSTESIRWRKKAAELNALAKKLQEYGQIADSKTFVGKFSCEGVQLLPNPGIWKGKATNLVLLIRELKSKGAIYDSYVTWALVERLFVKEDGQSHHKNLHILHHQIANHSNPNDEKLIVSIVNDTLATPHT